MPDQHINQVETNSSLRRVRFYGDGFFGAASEEVGSFDPESIRYSISGKTGNQRQKQQRKEVRGQEIGSFDSESIRYSITENTNQYRETTNKQRLLQTNLGSSNF